jgi:cobalt/nickel transport system ATP-binding protein
MSQDAMQCPLTPVFELDDVGYLYMGRLAALTDINLCINPGERVAVLGANGCGKSTLLKLLDGLYPPSTGRMRIFGEDIKTIEGDIEQGHQFHRQVGLVFQDPDVQLFSATVGDDVAFGPLQLGLPKVEVRRRVEAALEQMGILQLRDRAPFELSGGEKKRAAIASVLSMEPEVVLLDEPTASLDPRTKWVLVNLIEGLARSGRTLVTATHELEIVPYIADRVIVMGEQHTILADGPAEQIIADTNLLLRANLIHEHLHMHGGVRHSHPHGTEEHHEESAARTRSADGEQVVEGT